MEYTDWPDLNYMTLWRPGLWCELREPEATTSESDKLKGRVGSFLNKIKALLPEETAMVLGKAKYNTCVPKPSAIQMLKFHQSFNLISP